MKGRRKGGQGSRGEVGERKREGEGGDKEQ